MKRRDYRDVYITPEGKDSLEQELKAKVRALRKKAKERPDSNARSCGCSGNGVRMPGEDSRQENILAERTETIKKILAQAQVAPKPTDRDTVRIGCIISLVYRDGRNRRVREVHHIVGFEEGDCKATPSRLSYEALLAQHFLGQEKGHEAEVWKKGKLRLMTLTNIRIPK